MNFSRIVLIIFSVLPLSLCKAAEGPCTNQPESKWMARDEVRAKIQSEGYKIVEIEVENGCYAIEVRDKDGKELDLVIDPIDGVILRREQEP